MKELTKAETQVMQVLWDKGPCFVKEIVAEFPKPKPAYNTVSTIVRILESKNFVGHEAFGKSHRYHAQVEKNTYRKFSMDRMVDSYFSGSPSDLLSFFIKEKNLDAKELDEILALIKSAKNKKK